MSPKRGFGRAFKHPPARVSLEEDENLADENGAGFMSRPAGGKGRF